MTGSVDIGVMDPATPSSIPTFANRTPLHIGAVGLKVRDIEGVTGFYRDVLGLDVLDRANERTALGAGGVPFVHLEHRCDARPDDQREAGLYHTAFLMPTRGDLARWILHVARHKVALTGASDHAVSEAFYLDDPEGNGVEVYCDRPAETWEWTGSDLKITTDPLDVTRRRHGATFMSSGRYHHHIAANVWHSAGAARRDEDRAGLSWVALEAADATTFDAAKARLAQTGAELALTPMSIASADPWGTRLRITRG